MGRPKVKIELAALDKTMEVCCLILLIAYWAFVLYAFNNMPEEIPTHFNASGEVDSTGGKDNVWLLPVITTIMYILLTLLNRVPHIFNYPVEINEENASFQYALAMRLVRTMKLIIVLIFFAIAVLMFLVAKGILVGTGILVIILITVLPLIPVVFYFQKARQA